MNMDNSFETKLLEEKTEKLGFSLVVISVLIPVVLIAIGFFVYADLKKSIDELNSSKEKNLKKMSSQLEDTIFKNASKT
jgi:Tfp pilus assembly protein PilV